VLPSHSGGSECCIVTYLAETLNISMSRKPTWPFGPKIVSNQHNGLVGWWPLAPTGGSLVYDLERGNTGTITNGDPAILWVADGERGGNVLQLDGTGYVSAGDVNLVDDLGASGELTWSIWVRLDSVGASEAIIDKAESSPGEPGLTFWWDVSNGWRVDIDGSQSAYTSTTGYTANTWYHLVVVFNGNLTGDANRLKIYVDGVNQSLTFFGTIPATISSSSAPLLFGQFNGVVGQTLNGALDDIRLYSRALTSPEVVQLWNPQTRWELYDTTDVSPAILLGAQATATYNETATGGAVCGGTADVFVQRDETATGGVVVAGKALLVSIFSDADKSPGITWNTNIRFSVKDGQLLVAVFATDNDSSADGNTNLHETIVVGGQAMTKAREYTNSEGAVDAGATVSIWYLLPIGDIESGATVATSLNSGRTAKAITGFVIDIGRGLRISLDGTADAEGTGADPGAISATGIETGDHLWIRGTALEDANETIGWMTPTSFWEKFEDNGSTGNPASSNISVRGEWKFSTGTSSGTSDPTVESGADNATSLIGLYIDPLKTWNQFVSGGTLAGGSALVSYTANQDTTGGAVAGGSATTNFADVIDASGGVLVAGSATTTFIDQIDMTGGVVVGGGALILGGNDIIAAGGVVAGGSATQNFIDYIDATGGVVVGGNALLGETIDATGGVVVGGSATVAFIDQIDTTGGVVVAGTITDNIIANVVSTGGVVVAGVTTENIVINTDATGGVVVAGNATFGTSGDINGTGGAVAGGAADVAYTANVTATGGVVIAGMTIILGDIYAEGGVLVGGAADVTFADQIDATGGAVAGGTADVNVQRDEVAAGGVVVAGNSIESFSMNISPQGGVVVGGVHVQDATFSVIATGGVVCNGHAPLNFELDATGGVVVGGSAVGQTVFVDGAGGVSVGGSAIVEDDKIFLIVECPDGLYVCEPKGEDAYCLRYIDYISYGSPVFKDISKTLAKMPPIILCRQGIKNDLVVEEGVPVGGRSQTEELAEIGMGLTEFVMLSTVEANVGAFKVKAASRLDLGNYSPVKSTKKIEGTATTPQVQDPVLSNLALKAEFRREYKDFKKPVVTRAAKQPTGNIAKNTPQMARLKRANEAIRQKRHAHVPEEVRSLGYSRGELRKAPSKPDKPKIKQTAL